MIYPPTVPPRSVGVAGIQCIFHQENNDRNTAGNKISCYFRNTKQCIKSEGSSAHVADIEYKSSCNNQERYNITESGEYLIRHVLASHARYAEYAPYVKLNNR